MAAASSASLKLMRAEIKFLPPSPRRRHRALHSRALARSLVVHGRETSGWRLMVEHHVNKFGSRRRTEGCLLLIFELRAASKESTWRDAQVSRFANDVWPTRGLRHHKATSQRSSLDQMRNGSFRICASQKFLPRREPGAG